MCLCESASNFYRSSTYFLEPVQFPKKRDRLPPTSVEDMYLAHSGQLCIIGPKLSSFKIGFISSILMNTPLCNGLKLN